MGTSNSSCCSKTVHTSEIDLSREDKSDPNCKALMTQVEVKSIQDNQYHSALPVQGKKPTNNSSHNPTRDQDHSQQSNKPIEAGARQNSMKRHTTKGKKNTRLSQKEGALYKPTDQDNQLLITLAAKALPDKDRYKINVIPANNTGRMSIHSIGKPKSAEDLGSMKALEEIPRKPIVEKMSVKEIGKEQDFARTSKSNIVKSHMNMVEHRFRSGERRGGRTKSKLESNRKVSWILRLERNLLSSKRQASFRTTIRPFRGSEKEAMGRSSRFSTRRQV